MESKKKLAMDVGKLLIERFCELDNPNPEKEADEGLSPKASPNPVHKEDEEKAAESQDTCADDGPARKKQRINEESNRELSYADLKESIERLEQVNTKRYNELKDRVVKLEEQLKVTGAERKEPATIESSPTTTISGKEIDQQKLSQAKLATDPGKAALKLLSCLFTPEEMVNGNPTGITNSKDEHRKKTIQKLDPDRMKYIQDYLEEKWPGSSGRADIKRKMVQKCTDMYNDTKHKSLRL